MSEGRIRIAPSILTADFGRLAEQVRAAEAAGVDLMHLDVMDGHFVPPLSFGTEVMAAVKAATSLPVEMHLMVERPEEHFDGFAELGAGTQIFHFEAARDLDRCRDLIAQLRALGCAPAIAISPETPVSAIVELLPEIEQVTVMTIRPGWGGQSLKEELLAKVTAIRQAADALGRPDFTIEIDGGVKSHNIGQCVAAGADVLVAGSAVFNEHQAPSEAVAELRAAIGAPSA
ncbi:MAG: ribulose-phosphate 3-epimerase [Dehalococcoidia bacterium]|jgi:ribulose-phosphate 3-epimerase|nr:ribulose-phosphate 3-epimerase [Dehalococcoidia bacterium]